MSAASVNKSHTDFVNQPAPLWHHLVPFLMVVGVLTSIIVGAMYGLQFLADHVLGIIGG